MQIKKIIAFTTSLLICCGTISSPSIIKSLDNPLITSANDDTCKDNNTINKNFGFNLINTSTNLTITFDANGGTCNTISKTITKGDTYGSLPIPTREGYTFEGWFLSTDDSTQIFSNSVCNSSITLYAHWTKNITITFDANGGTCSTTSKTVICNSIYGTLPIPIRDGYIFKGWFTSTTDTNKIISSTKLDNTDDHTLYAHWIANNYKLSFDANGGTCSITSKTVTYDSTYDTLPTPTREGYTFLGWYTSINGIEKVTSSTDVNITDDQTLYAHWIVNTYDVTFDANGGMCSTISKNLTYSRPYGTLPVPTKTGYNFLGWYTSLTGDTEVTSNTILDIASNHTLYAHWNPNSYNVIFNANGGNCSIVSKTVTYNSTFGDLPTPTKENYKFNGWYTSLTGGVKVTSSSKVDTLSDCTLYAHWTSLLPDTYTITFDANGGICSTISKTITYDSTYDTLPIPTKDGYIFEGWYTSTNDGVKITDNTIFNLTENQTLYAHWSKVSEDKTIIFEQDTWKFTNNFGYHNSYKYYISDDFYSNLTDKLSNKEKNKISKHKSKYWQGSCYGLAILPILYKEDVFEASDLQRGASCLYDVNTPNNNISESIINYYYLLQDTELIQNTINNTITISESEKLDSLIELCSEVKNGGTPVLLCFFYDKGGHAVTCYGVEYGDYFKNNYSYDGRILIYDNNRNYFDDEYCLYFNSEDKSWYIPHYNTGSMNGGQLGLICNDLDIINNNGYFSNNNDNNHYDNIPPSIDNAEYKATMKFNNEINSINISPITYDDDGFTINGTDDLDDIVFFYNTMFSDENNVITEDLQNQAILPVSVLEYQFSVNDDKSEPIDLEMSYKNCLINVSADKGKSVTFSPNGDVELIANDSNVSLEMVFNEGYYNLPWYDIIIDGKRISNADVSQTDEGIILNSNNLANVTIYAKNDNVSTYTNFRTTAKSVLIYAIDEKTIGVKAYNSDKTVEVTGENIDDLLKLMLLKKSLLGESVPNMDLIDINYDGTINIIDIMELKNQLMSE